MAATESLLIFQLQFESINSHGKGLMKEFKFGLMFGAHEVHEDEGL